MTTTRFTDNPILQAKYDAIAAEAKTMDDSTLAEAIAQARQDIDQQERLYMSGMRWHLLLAEQARRS